MQKQAEQQIAISLVGQLKTAGTPAACAARPLATAPPSLLGREKTSAHQSPSEGRRQEDCLSRRMAFIETRVRAFRDMLYVLFTNCIWGQNKRCARGFSLPAAGTVHRLPSLKAFESPPYRLAVHLHAFNFVFYIEDLPPNLAAK